MTSSQCTYINVTYISDDTDLDHLAQVVFVRFVHFRVILSPPHFSYCAFWNEVILCRLHFVKILVEHTNIKFAILIILSVQ